MSAFFIFYPYIFNILHTKTNVKLTKYDNCATFSCQKESNYDVKNINIKCTKKQRTLSGTLPLLFSICTDKNSATACYVIKIWSFYSSMSCDI